MDQQRNDPGDASEWAGAQGWNPEGMPRPDDDGDQPSSGGARTPGDNQAENAGRSTNTSSTGADEAAGPDSGPSFRRLLSDTDRQRVSETLPELLELSTLLTAVDTDLDTYARPLSAEDTLAGLAATELAGRKLAAIQAKLTARFHREGTPEKHGATTTSALLREKLKLSTREAHRRDRHARHLGARVALDGTPLTPEYPKLSTALSSTGFRRGSFSWFLMRRWSRRVAG